MTTIRAALFDVDGVLVPPSELLSQYHARKYHGDLAALNQFFTEHIPALRTGQADLCSLIDANRTTWCGIDRVESFLDEWLAASDSRNEALIAYIQQLRQRGITCYAATNQDSYRAAYLKRAYRDVLDGYFISSEIGVAKPEAGFFDHAVQQLDLPAAAIVFFDDDPRNVAAAKQRGLQAFLYQDMSDVTRVFQDASVAEPV